MALDGTPASSIITVMQTMTATKTFESTLTTATIREILRELESPLNRFTRGGVTEAEQQEITDRCCAALGERGED